MSKIWFIVRGFNQKQTPGALTTVALALAIRITNIFPTRDVTRLSIFF